MATPDWSGNLILKDVQIRSCSSHASTSWTVKSVGISKGWAFERPFESLVERFSKSGAKVLDCQGLAILPGFVDSHCHVMAYASSLTAVDCRPSTISSISGIKEAIRLRALSTPLGEWVRAFGYDDFEVSEKRHPTKWDLDEISPNHPVRLRHRSGHAIVLNSLALSAVGINEATDEPTGGTIDRDVLSGEPTGLLLDMDGLVRDHMPRSTDEENRTAMKMASDKFLSYGITSVTDASPENTPQRYEAFKEMQRGGYFRPSVTMMAGANYLDSFLQSSLRMGVGTDLWNIGHVKIMLTLGGGGRFSQPAELTKLISYAHSWQFPVAIHTVEAEALEVAVNALEGSTPLPKRRWKDRIEHCAECPDRILRRIAKLGVTVVTNPGFLYNSGDRYMARTEGVRIPWLYRMKSLMKAGVPVAAGSDAPVTGPNPMLGIYSAITRLSDKGLPLNLLEKVSLDQALTMYTLGRHVSGRTQPADLVLLERPLNEDNPEEILKTKVAMTIRKGEVVYQA